MFNIRIAAAAACLAALQLAAIASQAQDEPELFEPGAPVAAIATGVAAWATDGEQLPQPVTGLSGVIDLCFAPDGTLFLSDEGADLVLRTDAAGAQLGALGAGTELSDPAGLALGPGGALFVSSRGTDSVLVFDADGAPAGELGAGAGLVDPWGLAFDAAGRLHVASSGADEVAVLDPSGARVATLGAGLLASPRGLCFGRDGRLYVTSHDADTLVVFEDGEPVATMHGEGWLDAPVGLAFGPDGLLYVTSDSLGSILVLTTVDTIAGSLQIPNALAGLSGIAFAPQVFRATLKGSLQRPGAGKDGVKAAGLLALRPGALPASLLFDDPDSEAAALLGAAAVWCGWSTDDRAFDGLQLGTAAAQLGLSDLHLDIKAVDRNGPTGIDARLPNKASGALHLAAPEGVLDARVKSGKRLP